MFIWLFRWYYDLREVEKMLTRSYLDALTSGMRAKLDPLSRMAREQRPARLLSIMRSEPDAAPSKYNLGPNDRYRRRQKSRTRVTDY